MPQKTQFPATPGIIALLVATGLCVLMQLYATIPLVDPVAADLETSSGTATLVLSTCFSLSYAAAFLVWGPVADHVGRRPVILTGLALLVVTSVGCALAPNVILPGVFRTLQGIGAASYAPHRPGLPHRGHRAEAPGRLRRRHGHLLPRRRDHRPGRRLRTGP